MSSLCGLQAYHDPMLTLSIMTEQELNQIFGTLDSLIPLHEGTVKPKLMIGSHSGKCLQTLNIHFAALLFSALRSVESPPGRQETGRINGTRGPHLD